MRTMKLSRNKKWFLVSLAAVLLFCFFDQFHAGKAIIPNFV